MSRRDKLTEWLCTESFWFYFIALTNCLKDSAILIKTLLNTFMELKRKIWYALWFLKNVHWFPMRQTNNLKRARSLIFWQTMLVRLITCSTWWQVCVIYHWTWLALWLFFFTISDGVSCQQSYSRLLPSRLMEQTANKQKFLGKKGINYRMSNKTY